MFRRGGFFRFLLVLVLVCLLVGGGVALYQAGFGQGYQAGALAAAASSDGTTHLAPAPGYYWPPYAGYGFPIFQPFGIFLGIGCFLFLFFVIGGLLRFGAWRHWGSHNRPDGWRYGPDPHWGQWGQPPETEKKEKNETI